MTKTETLIYEDLKKNLDRIMTRSDLAHHCKNSYGMSNVLDVHIRNLRVKLLGTSMQIISVWGVGYKMIGTTL